MRYRELSVRLRQLRIRFLPPVIDPTHAPTSREIDNARAYRLLTHAEIEHFLEDLCELTAIRAVNEWVTHRMLARTTLAILAYGEGNYAPTPTSLPSGRPNLDQRLDKAKDSLSTYVRVENNGIKESNVLRMMLPVGIREADFPTGWLQQIDSFGEHRGITAHTGTLGTGRVANAPHPHSEYATVISIRNGLRKLDRILNEVDFR